MPNAVSSMILIDSVSYHGLKMISEYFCLRLFMNLFNSSGVNFQFVLQKIANTLLVESLKTCASLGYGVAKLCTSSEIVLVTFSTIYHFFSRMKNDNDQGILVSWSCLSSLLTAAASVHSDVVARKSR